MTVADSNATPHGAPATTTAQHRNPRSQVQAHSAPAWTGAEHHSDRSRAAAHGGNTAPPVLFVMRARRIDASPGPVTWTVAGAPDATGANYPDGPGVLDPASIAVVARVA